MKMKREMDKNDFVVSFNAKTGSFDKLEDKWIPKILIDEIAKIYLDWYNTDLDEDVEAPKTLYKIGELLKRNDLL